MLARARRPTALLCIALLALNAVGCHQVNQREAQTVLQSGTSADTMKKVVGVILVATFFAIGALAASQMSYAIP